MSKQNPFDCEVVRTAGYPYYSDGVTPHGGEDYIPKNKNIEINWCLHAPADAMVYISKKQTGKYPGGYGAYGNYIVLECTDGWWIIMAHLQNKSPLRPGNFVRAGDFVGIAGDTGNTTGRHLHIELSDMRGVKYNGATWYEQFKRHRVRPSDYISFEHQKIKEVFFLKKWKNGNTRENVYMTTDDCAKGRHRIGYIYPYSVCDCHGIVNGMYLVSYNVGNTSNIKTGFVRYKGGIK